MLWLSDSQDNVYLTGSFTKTATLGKLSLEADGGTGLFIAKLNQDGKEQWMKKSLIPKTIAVIISILTLMIAFI